MRKKRRIALPEFKAWIDKSPYRQCEIAAALDVSPAFLCRVMHGDRIMPTKLIDELYNKFRVPKRFFSRAA